ncbi:Protein DETOXIFICATION 3, partial [Cucurbita argyrosperma subsp. sororia]
MRENWFRVYRKEVKKVILIAAPMAATTILQYAMQVVAVIMVGHLGDELLLSGVSIASSFTNVTGISVLGFGSQPRIIAI